MPVKCNLLRRLTRRHTVRFFLIKYDSKGPLAPTVCTSSARWQGPVPDVTLFHSARRVCRRDAGNAARVSVFALSHPINHISREAESSHRVLSFSRPPVDAVAESVYEHAAIYKAAALLHFVGGGGDEDVGMNLWGGDESPPVLLRYHLNAYLNVFTPPIGQRSIVMSVFTCMCMCLRVSVCPRSYLRNYMSDLHQFLCVLPMAVARSRSDGVMILHVFPVLWMTSYLHIS